jgi:hypothetical protein
VKRGDPVWVLNSSDWDKARVESVVDDQRRDHSDWLHSPIVVIPGGLIWSVITSGPCKGQRAPRRIGPHLFYGEEIVPRDPKRKGKDKPPGDDELRERRRKFWADFLAEQESEESHA